MQVSCESKRPTFLQWKWPENAFLCKQRDCTTHCEPETTKIGDNSNVCVCVSPVATRGLWWP